MTTNDDFWTHLERGCDIKSIRGATLLFWYFFVLVFCIFWVSASFLFIFGLFLKDDLHEIWPLAIMFFLVSCLLIWRLIPDVSKTLFREAFCKYSVRTNGDILYLKASSFAGEKTYSLSLASLQVEMYGFPLTPVCVTVVGKSGRSFTFGALFTKTNWEKLEKVIAEQLPEPY